MGLIGSLKDLTIVWPGLSPGKSLRFSASVLPVTVMQSPLSKPSASKYFITPGVPPIEWRSSCTNLPEGFKSARYATRLLVLWKSLSVRGTFTLRAMANK